MPYARILFSFKIALLFTIGTATAQSVSSRARIQALGAEVLAAGCDALGQDAVSARDEGRRALETATSKLVLSGFTDLSLSEAPGSVATNGASIEVTKEGKAVGKAQIAWHGTANSLNLTLTGPINDEGEGDALTGHTLAPGAGWTIGYSHSFWSKESSLGNALRTNQLSGCAPVTNILRDDVDAVAFVLGYAARAAATRSAPTGLAALSGPSTRPETLQLYADRLVALSGVTVSQGVTFNVSYGETNNEFKYLTAANLTPQKERHKTFERSVGLAYGRTHTFEKDGTRYQWPHFSAGIGYQFASGLKAAPARNICTPFGDGATQCQNISTAAPTAQERRELRIDVRHWSYADKLAVNPNFVRDFENDTDQAEFRISFLRLAKKDLGPGVPNYILDNDALSVGARLGHVWDRKEGKPDEGSYFVIFFSASLGAWKF